MLWTALFAVAVQTVSAGNVETAWNRLFAKFYEPKTGLLYEHLPDEAPGAVTRHLPTPEEIARAYPIPTGWNTGMEDGVLNGCPLLLAAMLRNDSAAVEKLLNGLLRCATVSGVPGFLVRSISPADGKSVYPDSSRDQYTLFVYTMWRFSQSPLCSPSRRAEIGKIVLDIAWRTEKCMDEAHDFTLVRLDGRPGIVSKMWMANPKGEIRVKPNDSSPFPGHAWVEGGVWAHEANRLPMIYAAAHALSGDARWRTLELKVADDALRIAEGGISKELKGFALYQMQVSLRLLWECETDPVRRVRYLKLLRQVAGYGVLCLDRAERLHAELKGDLSTPAGDWRRWPMEELPPSSGLTCLKPTRPKGYLKAYDCVREMGEGMIVPLLCPGFRIAPGTVARFRSLVDKSDFSRCMSPGLVYPVLADAMLANAAASGEPENIALGRPYAFGVQPNYGRCTDAGDAVQLTDGRWFRSDAGGFWTDRSVVGWNVGAGLNARTVTVDLGRDEPITGFSWNFAAGRANVSWPDLIFVYVSTDGRRWRFAGDLYGRSKAENGPPKEDGFGIYRAHSVRMPCHGRYVMFLVRAANYTFVDEVEVYRGDASLMSAGDDAEPIEDPLRHEGSYRGFKSFFSDAERLGLALQGLGEADRDRARTELFRLNAIVLRARGGERPYLWSCDRWASADFLDFPKDRASLSAPLEVEMMRGETRSEAVNLSNPTGQDIEVEIRAEGFPVGANVELREVVPTVVKSGARVGGLLMGDGGAKLRLKVPAGTTRQIWISFAKPTCAAGAYNGRIVAGAASKPLVLRLAAVDFPSRPRLHVGGWDYTEGDGGFYGSTSNLQARLARMREIFTDTPWARSCVMPGGAEFDASGRLTNAGRLDFSAWNEWVGRWGGQARQYCVFMSVRDEFHGERMGTDRFNRMVGEYMRAWSDGVKAKLAGRRIVVLLVDEPTSASSVRIIGAWSKAIKAAAPEFAIFEEFDCSTPDADTKALCEACDIICPSLPVVTAKGAHVPCGRRAGACGKELWFYSCCGPSRTFDPCAYYRAQAWQAWKCGAKGSMFWAFGCGGGIADSFRPFEQPQTEYSPFFVSPTNAYRAKQSEALLEGVEDYEYLAMLSDRVSALARAGKDVTGLRGLLAAAPDRALPEETWLKGNDYDFFRAFQRYDWFLPRDRAPMDRVRIEILRALAAIRP